MIESKGYKITPIDGDLAVSRNTEIGRDVDIHGKARVAGSLKVEGFLDAPNIKGAVKGLFATEEELKREYPNPRPGWCAIVLANKENGFLYLAKNREWEKQSEEAKPFEFIVDSINVFASKGELADETQRAQNAENQLQLNIEAEADTRMAAVDEIKGKAALFGTFAPRADAEGVLIKYENINHNEGAFSIPVATEGKAGIVSAADKKHFVKSITWNNDTDQSNMNDFVVAGVYDIKGEHKRVDDNLPVLNIGGGHSFNARLTVLDSSISGDGKDDDKCITQVLSFSNRLGQGEVYIRTGKGSSLDSLAWEKWSTLQRNVNVEEVGSLDDLKDNGIYSGVWKQGRINPNYLAFVCIVINDYFIGTVPRRVSQFVYGLSKFDGSVVYQSRVWDDSKDKWSDWEILNQKEIASMISAEIKKVTDGIDPNKIDSLKDIITWIEEHGDVANILAAIEGLSDGLGQEIEARISADNTTRSMGVLFGGFSNRQTTAAEVVIGYKSIDQEHEGAFSIPAATTEKAGVMSAADKTTLSSIDLNTYITNTLDSDNLINFEKPLYKGYFIGYGGVLSANSQYNIHLVPMNGKSIVINIAGSFYLAAVDKAGKITHVNSENANNNKVIEYLEGDVYALVSVPKSSNTSVARYVDTYIADYTRYNTPVGINELEKLEEKCTDVYRVIKNSYSSKELLSARILNDCNITVLSSGDVNLGNNSYNNCYSYKVSFVDKRDYVKINTKTAISSIVGFNSSTSPTTSPISVYKNIIGEVTLIITPDELGSNTHIWFACDKNVTPNVELFSFSEDAVITPNNSIEPKAATFFNRNLFNIDDADVIVGKFLTKTGSISTNAAYIISGFIPFNREMGKLLAVRKGNPNMYMGGAYCYYNANKEYIKGYNYSEKRIAEWEEGVAYVRFSLSNEDGQIIVVGNSVFPYMEYGDEKVNNRYISNQYCGVDAITETIGSIADGVTYELTKLPYHIKKNVGVSLSADLATMGTVIVGKGYNQYRGMWVEVDSTNVNVYKYENSASDIYTAEHGLDINTFIKVNLFLDSKGCLQIIIFSKGGCYKTSVEDCGYEMNYAPFVSCSGTSLSNVKLGASCADIRLPVWVFGDSYLGVTANRWPGIVKDFGYFNVMFDGLPGITSEGIYEEVYKLLSMSIPKYIVWCLGMNDKDSDYKNYFTYLKEMCDNTGITLIAATIPTVPTRSKEEITNYVKSSGVRYIDMYSAVGATSTGSWHEGMLSSDGVHPTELGAQALAMQVLTDFPEIMQY